MQGRGRGGKGVVVHESLERISPAAVSAVARRSA